MSDKKTMTTPATPNTLAVAQQQIAIPLTELQTMAQSISKSGMFGVTNEHQAMCLLLLCQAEGIHPILALRRYHIIEGRPSYRADALQGEFEKTGAILWHSRTDQECAATFFLDKTKVTKDATERAKQRYKRLKESGPVDDLAEINEITIIRTIEDAREKRIATSWQKDAADGQGGKGAWLLKKNWKQSPRQMLHARCLTEGVRAIAPGIIAGVYTEDEIDSLPATNGAPTNGEAMTSQDRVAQAAENATATEAEIVGEEPRPTTAAPATQKITEVTEFNWRDLECHIGNAEGPLLGKKVGEFPPAIISWLQRKFVAALKEPVNARDAALAKATEFAAKQPRTALWLKFKDEWEREEFFEAMKALDVFKGLEPEVSKFDEIPEDKAQSFLESFEEAKKIAADYHGSKKAAPKKKAKT